MNDEHVDARQWLRTMVIFGAGVCPAMVGIGYLIGGSLMGTLAVPVSIVIVAGIAVVTFPRDRIVSPAEAKSRLRRWTAIYTTGAAFGIAMMIVSGEARLAGMLAAASVALLLSVGLIYSRIPTRGRTDG